MKNLFLTIKKLNESLNLKNEVNELNHKINI